MYESPIDKIYGDIQNQIIKQDEEHLMYTVNQAIGYKVDKEELLKALQYDRNQYNKGFKDACKEYDDMVISSNWHFYNDEFPEDLQKEYGLFDLIAKYGGEVVLQHWKSWKSNNDI